MRTANRTEWITFHFEVLRHRIPVKVNSKLATRIPCSRSMERNPIIDPFALAVKALTSDHLPVNRREYTGIRCTSTAGDKISLKKSFVFLLIFIFRTPSEIEKQPDTQSCSLNLGCFRILLPHPLYIRGTRPLVQFAVTGSSSEYDRIEPVHNGRNHRIEPHPRDP